jgi:AcrR family transcriptional regulator
MGHREDLLEGAKRCLYEKGYARTTARDIVAASGTNLASIGYHFGSKEALLNAALVEAITAMGTDLIKLSTDDMTGPAETDLARGWDKVIARFDEYRPLLIAQLEAWAQLERSPELRAELASADRVDLLGPMHADCKWQAQAAQGFDASHFHIDWEQQRATCPGG